METVDNILLAVHVAAGFASLFIFWIPALSRKGGKAHRFSGRLYVRSMWIVVATGFFLSLINLVQGSYIAAGFLGFLTFLTAFPLWHGIAILNYKKNIPDRLLLIRRLLTGIVFFGGIGLITWSLLMHVEDEAILLLIFGILGLFAGGDVWRSDKKLRSEANWLREHLNGMIISGIAAYTAFFAFGGSRFFRHLFDDTWVFIPWVLPGLIGTLAIRAAQRKWKVA